MYNEFAELPAEYRADVRLYLLHLLFSTLVYCMNILKLISNVRKGAKGTLILSELD